VETRYTPYVRFIDREWNSRYSDRAENPVIYHYCSKPKPIDEMREKYAAFVQNILRV
jgi:hypothetical protein